MSTGRINRNLSQSHPATTATINFYSLKRGLETELGRTLTTPEAKAILSERGQIKDQRTGNSAAMKQTASLKGGTTFGTTLHPYDGQSPDGDRMGKPAIEPRTGVNSGWSNHPRYYEQKTAAEAKLGRALSNEEFERDHFVVPDSEIASGTSIFDPVLCELAYRWFSPPSGSVLDPFAGGSVRGIVASKVGRSYTGVELRAEQVEANRKQADRIISSGESKSAAPAQPASTITADAIVEIFKQHDKGLIAARFTPGAASVAEWFEKGNLRVALVDGKPVAALAMRQFGRPKSYRDFADWERGVAAPGEREVIRVACKTGHHDALIALIDAEALNAEWFNLWMEHPVDQAVAQYLSLTWRGSRVTAAAELFGIYSRSSAKIIAVQSAEMLTLARLDLTLDVSDMVAALSRLPEWAEHYSSYNKRHSWYALALRGYGSVDFIEKPAEMGKKWKEENPDKLSLPLADTALRKALPEAEALIAAIPGVKHRIRLMRLTQGKGELARHADITDPDAGVAPTKLLRIHIPIITNPKVLVEQWNLKGENVACNMKAGEAWYLDTRKPHRVVNQGASDRVHLVMDVESSPALLALMGSQAPVVRAPEPAELESPPEVIIDRPNSGPPPSIGVDGPPPTWIIGDSTDIRALAPGEYDFIFSCPPYGDLEVYSDNPADISNMDWDAFMRAYTKIISEACAMLKPDRFACFVVGDFRDKKGNYRNFPAETIAAFQRAGLAYYNDAVLVTSVGSLPIRVAKQFTVSRKLGHTHQDVLCFVKGDPKRATEACGPVEVPATDEPDTANP